MKNTWKNLKQLLKLYPQKEALEKVKKVYVPPRSHLPPAPAYTPPLPVRTLDPILPAPPPPPPLRAPYPIDLTNKGPPLHR